MKTNRMVSSIESARVIICAGTGGVGKTTVAAALGIRLAQMGYSTLVLTVDPSKRLASALGIDPDKEEESLVPGQNYAGKLYASVVVPQAIFQRFLESAKLDPGLVERLSQNRLYRQLSTTLSGSQEFTSLEKLFTVFRSGRYQRIVLDTPPSQHAIDFLRAPQRLFSLFDESITRWFRREGKGFFSRVFSRSTETVLKILERITGAIFVTELREFFANVSTLEAKIRSRTKETHELLHSPDTQFVLVTGAEKNRLSEASSFSRQLKLEGFSLSGVVINRWGPKSVLNSLTNKVEDKSLTHLPSEIIEAAKYFEKRLQLVKDFKVANNLSWISVLPDHGEIEGLKSLERLADLLEAHLEGDSERNLERDTKQ